MLPQSKTEELLESYLQELDNKIERSIELVDITYNHEMVTATLKYENGYTESVTSNWLIACDGANSMVREKCDFHFPGEDLKEQFIVADATIDFSYMSKDEVHFFFDSGTILTAFPLGKNKIPLSC
jgi:3-(3-hydroxy-phenyl)propionate hydroxylase